jgi:protein TonB
MRKEATVIVRVLVDERGRVTDAQLKGSPAGFGFDQAALQAARGARFSPATENGSPVKMWVDLPIKFSL